MLLTHIILPRYLPQEISHDLDYTDAKLLHEMVDNVVSLSGIIPTKTVKLFQSMRKIHDNMTPTRISNEINGLRSGDSFAIFVRRQRWMFIIHAPEQPPHDKNATDSEPQEVIVASFPGNVRPSEIYKHESDIEVIFIVKNLIEPNKIQLTKVEFFPDFAAKLPIQCDKSEIFKNLTIRRFCKSIVCPLQ